MSYIKIYPKKLSLEHLLSKGAKTDGSSIPGIEGKVFYDIELYGHLHPKKSFDILLVPDQNIPNQWRLQPTSDHPEIKNFEAFIKSFNYYLFKTLKIQIESPKDAAEISHLELNLQKVYFVMDTDSNTNFKDYLWTPLG